MRGRKARTVMSGSTMLSAEEAFRAILARETKPFPFILSNNLTTYPTSERVLCVQYAGRLRIRFILPTHVGLPSIMPRS